MTAHPKDGGPAFPFDQHGHDQRPGMTLRDYFAAAALTGIVSHHGVGLPVDKAAGATAVCAYEFADAMLAERKEE